jgi:hypothetical protein
MATMIARAIEVFVNMIGLLLIRHPISVRVSILLVFDVRGNQLDVPADPDIGLGRKVLP